MHFPTLPDVHFTGPLVFVGGLLAILVLFGNRRHRRFTWIRWYFALCLGFSVLLYLIPSEIAATKSYHWVDLIALLTYSSLECRLIFLFLRNEPLPPTRQQALDIACSVFFYFWLLIWLGSPRFILADTATMMAAEALTVTVLAIIGLESRLLSSSFTQFMRSNAFSILLSTLGYFSFSMPVFLLLVLLNAQDHSDTLLFQGKSARLASSRIARVVRRMTSRRQGPVLMPPQTARHSS